MKSYGVYLKNGTDEGIKENIRANIVRDPKVRDALAEQCKILDIIDECLKSVNA